VTSRKSVHEDIHVSNNNGYLTNNQQIISNSFNDHILSTINRVNSKTSNNSKPDRNKLVTTLSQILNIITDQIKKSKTL